MNAKNDFLTALAALPEALQPYLAKVIPTLTAITLPTDEKTATVAQGLLAYNINLILKEFEGLPPLMAVLRAGQHNPVFQGILLSALEAVNAQEPEMRVLSPENGHSYAGEFSLWLVQVLGAEPVKVNVAVTSDVSQYSRNLILAPIGGGIYQVSAGFFCGDAPQQYNASISAVVAEQSFQAAVSFTVTPIPTP